MKQVFDDLQTAVAFNSLLGFSSFESVEGVAGTVTDWFSFQFPIGIF